MKTINTSQIKLIRTLLSVTQQTDQKESLVLMASNNRTTHISELTNKEFKKLAGFLRGDNESDIALYRRAVIYDLAIKSGIIPTSSGNDDEFKMNIAKLNTFCRTRGTVKKDFEEQNSLELQRTLRQFEAIYNRMKQRAAVKEMINLINN